MTIKLRLLKSVCSRSIGASLLLSVLGGAFVGLGAMSLLVYQVLNAHARNEIRKTLRIEVREIESQIDQIEMFTASMKAAVQAERSHSHVTIADYKRLTFEFFQQRPSLVMGSGFGQTAYGIFPHHQWFYPYFYVDQGSPDSVGDRLPAPHQNIRYLDVIDAEFYSKTGYYQFAIQTGKSAWHDPYDWYGITIATYSDPLVDEQGKSLGFTVADLNVTAISKQINNKVIHKQGYFILLSQQGHLLGYPPDPTKVKTKASYRDIPELQAIWPRIQVKPSGLLEAGGQIWAYDRIAGTNWLMLAVVPRSVVVLPVLGITLGGALGAGIILFLVVNWFVRRLNQRLQPLLAGCDQLVLTNTDADMDTTPILGMRADMDELEILSTSFVQMAKQLQDAFNALQKSNEELEHRVEERTAELKTAKLVADSANQAKSEFLANMSHELRTPLNGILGYAQILKQSEILTQKGQNGIDIIYRCGSHLLNLINDILDLSKIEARKLELYPTVLHLPSFLQSVIEINRIRAEQKGIPFNVQIDSQLPIGVWADEKRLRQVLINLLGNAIKFTDDGRVTFKVEFITPKISFSVADTGVGMNPEQIAKIFLPFEQVGDPKKQAEGTGLGLTITQKIVALMDSEIQVESVVGQGSTFSFTLDLPPAENWATAARVMSKGMIQGYQGVTRRILVIDDSWENRSVLINLLEPIGFEMIAASNGEIGFAEALKTLPDLIITDLAMPVMDGLEFLQKLRSHPQLQHQMVLVSSASVFDSDRHKSLDAGGNDFLPKPVQAETLLALLEKYLRLDWVYDSNSTVTHQSGVVISAIQPPTDEILQQLFELAQDGELDGVIEVATHIQQPNTAEFTQEIIRLAEACQLKELRAFIQHYLSQ